MKYTTVIAAITSTALAQSSCSSAPPAATPSPAPPAGPNYFTVISTRSASPVHFLTLTARGLKFYLGGGPPSSYCPPNIPAGSCPPGNSTVLAGGYGTLGMGTVVPGGQEVYVAPDGALSYTQAHSAAVPAGSYRAMFSREAPSGGNSFGYLNFETGFVACPAKAPETGYQVFGQVEGATFGPECLGFNALTSEVQQPGAWQY